MCVCVATGDLTQYYYKNCESTCLAAQVLEPHANEVAKVVKACMEGACSLLVPLVAHPRIGKTWASMTDIEADG